LSISAKILLVVSLSVLPCVGAVLWSILRLERGALSEAVGQCGVIAASIAGQQRIVLESARQVLSGTAEAPPVRDLDADEVDRVLSSLEETNPYFAGMALVDARGAVVASSFAWREDEELNILAAEARARGRFVVGSFSGSASRASLAAAAPVGTGTGRWSGALVARLDMRGGAGRMSFAGIPEWTTVSILDRSSRLLYRYPPSSAEPLGRKAEGPIAAALEGGGGTPGDDARIGGEGSVVGASSIDADEDGVADVYVAAASPRSAALARLRAAARWDALVVAAAAILSLATALAAAGRSIVSRVAALDDAARRYERGDLAARETLAGAGRGGDELDRLASAMASMAGAILSREKAREAIELDLRKAVAEREVILREVHHRVYNNFQLVLSLMRIGASAAPEASAAEVMRASERRILAMALVHEKLYQSGRLARIDVSDYLESALARLRHERSELPAAVRLDLEAERVFLDISKAIPFGLAASELVSNCLEHAFAGRDRGSVRIGLRTEADGLAVLEVRDDGSGMDSGDGRRGLGLQLARSLSEQLGGRLEIESPDSGGTRAILSFPLSA
jgi:two-component sensor histidine kinase